MRQHLLDSAVESKRVKMCFYDSVHFSIVRVILAASLICGCHPSSGPCKAGQYGASCSLGRLRKYAAIGRHEATGKMHLIDQNSLKIVLGVI